MKDGETLRVESEISYDDSFTAVETKELSLAIMRYSQKMLRELGVPRITIGTSLQSAFYEQVFQIGQPVKLVEPRVEVTLCGRCGQHVFARLVPGRSPEHVAHDAPCGLPCRRKRGRRDNGRLGEPAHVNGVNGHVNNGKCGAKP